MVNLELTQILERRILDKSLPFTAIFLFNYVVSYDESQRNIFAMVVNLDPKKMMKKVNHGEDFKRWFQHWWLHKVSLKYQKMCCIRDIYDYYKVYSYNWRIHVEDSITSIWACSGQSLLTSLKVRHNRELGWDSVVFFSPYTNHNSLWS